MASDKSPKEKKSFRRKIIIFIIAMILLAIAVSFVITEGCKQIAERNVAEAIEDYYEQIGDVESVVSVQTSKVIESGSNRYYLLDCDVKLLDASVAQEYEDEYKAYRTKLREEAAARGESYQVEPDATPTKRPTELADEKGTSKKIIVAVSFPVNIGQEGFTNADLSEYEYTTDAEREEAIKKAKEDIIWENERYDAVAAKGAADVIIKNYPEAEVLSTEVIKDNKYRQYMVDCEYKYVDEDGEEVTNKVIIGISYSIDLGSMPRSDSDITKYIYTNDTERNAAIEAAESYMSWDHPDYI